MDNLKVGFRVPGKCKISVLGYEPATGDTVLWTVLQSAKIS